MNETKLTTRIKEDTFTVLTGKRINKRQAQDMCISEMNHNHHSTTIGLPEQIRIKFDKDTEQTTITYSYTIFETYTEFDDAEDEILEAPETPPPPELTDEQAAHSRGE